MPHKSGTVYKGTKGHRRPKPKPKRRKTTKKKI